MLSRLLSFEGETRKIKCNADERCRRRLDGAEPLSAQGAEANESRHLDHAKRTDPCGRFFLCIHIGIPNIRHPASKAGYLLWVKPLCAASGRYSRVVCVQRSIKTRISASPKFLSGTANRGEAEDAASSSLATWTIKAERAFALSAFIF